MIAMSNEGLHLYNTLLFVHIVFAAVWLGGGIMTHFYAMRAMKASRAEAISFLKMADWAGKKVFMPSSIIVLVWGLWMVLAFDVWKLTDPWVWIGLLGIVVSGGIGSGVVGPAAAKLSDALQSDADQSVIDEISKKIMLFSRIDLIVLTVIVWDMAYKPFSPGI
jgi:uncharacterized membrane protein